ncbi:hypothetical protein EVAR_39839_1 [Eumeta japonica]|uniref:Uncharacterized protein n=1 Tax=Eumeta variegata TaxID=151549 RepID=A0A4C1X9W7_EUMVA|nr:hypothetical protein EVAR_39839_1 [Eumeta japonica]
MTVDLAGSPQYLCTVSSSNIFELAKQGNIVTRIFELKIVNVQFNARNFAAVKFVTKASQWRKTGTRRREEGRPGERNNCAVWHSQPKMP